MGKLEHGGEGAPEPPEEAFIFHVGDEEHEATPENTNIVRHTRPEDRKYDYIASTFPIDGDEEELGLFVNWRGEEDTGEFDELAADMIQAGFPFSRAYQVNDSVREMYESQSPPEIIDEPKDLTQRQESRIEYLAHLLETGELSPEDFLVEGELNI
jgi:hypothetical protein